MQERALLLLAVAALAGLPLAASNYFVTLMNYIGIGALAALGLVLLTGVGGLTSFGQAAFVGIGAYATAWWTTVQGGSPWVGLVLAVAFTFAVAIVLGAATLRLGGHLLPLSTIAWGLAIFFLFGNIEGLGRHNGISAIPPVTLGGLSFQSGTAGYYLVWATLGAVMWLCANLLGSRQGRAIRSLRGGTAMAESLGIDTFRIRLAVFVLAGVLAGLSGWLFAHVQRFISPTAFDVGPGMEYLFMAMLGGAGHIGGAVLGSALVTLAKDALQDLLPALIKESGQLEVVVFGALFILVLQHARGGLIPSLQRLLPRATPPVPPDAPPLPRRAPPAAGGEVLVVDGVVKRFGGLVAVNQVGFELRAGEILGLIGPNGAGKSTLFNLVCGTATADAGRIRFLGQDIAGLPARRIAARGIARTFQHVRLRPTMTLLENVMLGAHLRARAGLLRGALRLDRAEERAIRAEAMRQLRRVGLDPNPHELAGNLPLGQQRILEVARALAADPLLIILDEPAAGLRRLEKQKLAELLRALRAEGMTILLVEHDMEFVMGLVDRIVVMEFGTRIAEGPPASIRADARVQEAYLGGVA
ncbi:branched-chain amino acid ABC transporter ATP-binding protein/permease [Limobrevibacterium gyesilva]|uniref:Branched-chain amino acid ABC transporter ATP-binding protein/permease n=1 Tax=Limobrevibacterium gyesilva TaxID=2991712 RepID=A0AA41YSQ5_9PROT|nr:branched-chain amino acid ABC transporter ATP-binding protein/permease [Limobrevibacterium gyesilva]MCW3475810.1 branched-chain amino acid ABC transporter ATP-binding protein/permease [Limobrevibacterium gyesilva]